MTGSVTTWRPMLATSATTLPVGSDWTYEVKWDGYRVLAIKSGPRVHLISRNEKDLTRAYPIVAKAIAQLAPAQVTRARRHSPDRSAAGGATSTIGAGDRALGRTVVRSAAGHRAAD